MDSMKKNRILLLEDNTGLAEGLCYFLTQNGYTVETEESACKAKELLLQKQYDLLLLDVTLPDGTGFEICERVRAQGNQVPIIFLTASDQEMDIIRGLDCGGDDYIGKPFRLGELLSRIRALLRRAGIKREEDLPSCQDRLVSGNLQIDLAGSRVFQDGEKLELTQVEYRLLCLLVRSHGRVVPREIIFEELWDNSGNFVDDNTLSVYIRRLREKIEKDPSKPRHLITARGFGYRWQEY